MVVIGASAGGIGALTTLFESIPPDFPAPIALVLHQRGDSAYMMTQAIQRMTELPVVAVAKTTLRLTPGVVYVPEAGKSLTLQRGKVREAGRENFGRFTSIDLAFASAAEAYGDRVLGIILTGMQKDGTKGLKAIHEKGGLTIVQDPQGAEFPDMPRNAMTDLPVTFCLGVSDIGLALDLLVRRSSGLETGIAVSIQMLKKRVALLMRLKSQSGRNLGSSEFLEEELVKLRRDLASVTRLLDGAAAPRRRRR